MFINFFNIKIHASVAQEKKLYQSKVSESCINIYGIEASRDIRSRAYWADVWKVTLKDSSDPIG